jgi:uracil-DNA glycosylase
MDGTIDDLIEAVAREAAAQNLAVDRPVYERLGKDPARPVLFAGSLHAPVCAMGRDLGKDEVRLGQPLVGAGGRLVRLGILRAREPQSAEPSRPRDPLEGVLRHALLTNTVPFKPSGNKAYPEGVRSRFRPLVLRLLTEFWTGRHILTLGTEAFRWFEPYGDRAEFESVGKTDARFEHQFPCLLPGPDQSRGDEAKRVVVLPLPHPSPLNRRWLPRFPDLLARRLAEVGGQDPAVPNKGR